jgi:hypothetical protein
LSPRSRVVQAKRLLPVAARHWLTRTVFPEPAGALIRMSCAVVPDSRLSTAGRSSHSGRISGGAILVSSDVERSGADADGPLESPPGTIAALLYILFYMML